MICVVNPMKKKIIFLVIFMYLIMCTTSFVLSIIHCESIEKAPSVVTQQEMNQRIDSLYRKLGEGSFFNCGRNDACGEKTTGHSCDACSLTLVMRNNWFEEMFGRLSTDQFPSTYYSSGRRYGPKGYSCYGFASFSEWYLSSLSKNEFVRSRFIGAFSYDYESLRDNALTGDLIRLDDRHSAIVISCDETGVKVLDNNKKGEMNCQVFIHTIPYSEYEKVTVNRSMNSEFFKGDKAYTRVLEEQETVKNYKDSFQLVCNRENVEWYSSDPEIATVDETGTVNILGEGKIKIMVSDETGVIDYCEITAEYSLLQRIIMNYFFGWLWY